MANDTQTQTETLSPSIGGRLKSVREGLGQTRKDIAAQLRLSEAVIVMMEENKYPADLPPTFIRGYIRAYGKLIGIPEAEIQAAIEPIKPIAQPMEQAPISKPATPITSSNYFMQFSTYIIVLTITGLAGGWWYTHTSSAPTTVVADNNPSNTQTKTLTLPVNDIITENQVQAANQAPATPQDQATPGQQLAPALGAAIAETNSQPAEQQANNKQNVSPAPDSKKIHASSKPAYLRHQHDDDDDQ